MSDAEKRQFNDNHYRLGEDIIFDSIELETVMENFHVNENMTTMGISYNFHKLKDKKIDYLIKKEKNYLNC